MDPEPLRVLLVEDNPGDARLFAAALRDAGSPPPEVVPVERLSAALERLEAEHFDVALLDLMLPDSEGLDTVRRLHARGRSLPIIVLTGLDDEETARGVVEAGAQDFILKGEARGPALLRALRYAIERKRAEEELREAKLDLERRVAEQTAEVTAYARELEAFSYSVSHDLRAPLRALDGFSEALLDDYGDRLDERGRHYLERIRSASQRFADLIDGLLALAGVTRVELHRQTVDLVGLAREVDARERATSPDRSVEFVAPAELPAFGDPRLLRLLFEVLLGNAWKFTGHHPRARIEVGVVNSGPGSTYFVRDDGAGFPMEYAGKLFHLVERLHAASDFPGTGLGLAVADRIVRRHGGRIWAEGVVEGGATFWFTLAPAPGAEPLEPPAGGAAEPSG